jgi:cell division protease FtsH
MIHRFQAWRRRRRTDRGGRPLSASWLLLGLLAALLAAGAAGFAYLAPADAGRSLTLDELTALADAGEVADATFQDEDARIVGTLEDGTAYAVTYPRSDATTSALVERLATSGARVAVDPQVGKGVVRVLVTVLLPLVILADLFALLLTWTRGGSSGMGTLTSFGQIGDRRAGGDQQRLGFADVAGIDDAVVELREVVDYLKDPSQYDALGASPPKGVLLAGPPGVGKTLLAKVVAGEAGVPFFSVAGAEFVESLVGVGAARVRDLFRRIRAVAPAIVFIDELDAAGRRRGAGGVSGGSDEREQTLNQLLVEMDGFAVSAGIVVMAASNRPDILDPALLRPGRFDRHVHIDRPDVAARERILALHVAKRDHVAADVDLAGVARRTPGFTGADLANVVNEAALLAVRRGADTVAAADLDEAVLRVMSGSQRRGHLLDDEERARIALHEAGHAVVAAAVGRTDDVHRVSLVARGRSLGSATPRDGDAVVRTRSQLTDQLTILMAGVAAEELVLGEPSTGAEDDLEHATALARDMVGRFGMHPELGPVRLLGHDADTYLGGEAALRDLSDDVHARFDRAVADALEQARGRATELLTARRDRLDAVTTAVIASETVEGAALGELLEGVAAPV